MVVVASSDDAGDMNDEQWFYGRVEGGPDADACLSLVRQLAPAVLGGLVTADDTGAIPYSCLMTVDVPGVPRSDLAGVDAPVAGALRARPTRWVLGLLARVG